MSELRRRRRSFLQWVEVQFYFESQLAEAVQPPEHQPALVFELKQFHLKIRLSL